MFVKIQFLQKQKFLEVSPQILVCADDWRDCWSMVEDRQDENIRLVDLWDGRTAEP